MAPNATKGRNYLDQLDNARCEGDWEAVPELIRKVRKHAPNRACLALTAEIECGIVKSTKSQKPAAARPPTADSSNSPATEIEVAAHLPKVLTLIDEEHTYAEDRFQAQVCVGWLHWVVGEYNLAFVRLPDGLEETQVESLDNISEWTRVCMLKSAYLRANCLARNEKEVDALAVFEAAIPPSSYPWSSQTAKKELRYWSELFLTEYCMLSNGCRGKGDVSLEDDNSLAAFRSWARWWDASKGSTLAGGFGFKGSVPRRRIWFEYYEALSTILQDDLAYPTKYMLPAQSEPSARGQLLVELKKAETAFEALLLNETSFPKADEDREEVELFVEMFTRNWTILTGRGWSERDLGQGGKAGLSASTLEMLYRASTKTFHSTAILRNLFLVHLSVAEFDLALKAFDSYLDIVQKGKARVEKTGHEEKTLDDDATVLETISRTCECAFEQFRDPVVLFGRQAQFKSDHLNEAEKDPDASQGLVDEMDDFEKENILEIKMTQLAIVEVVEGPRVAVNASLELLTLFSRLFGSVQSKQNLEPPKPAVLPRTSGTFRSIRSGIFGNRNSRADRRDSNGTTISRAPTIQVTQENGSPRARRKSTSNEKRIVDGETFYTPMPGPEGLQASDFFTFANKRNPLSRPSSASRANSQLAEMYDDAKGAVNEAQKLVQTMESDLGKASADSGKKSAGSSSLRKPGWAGQKSIEELWADVWNELGKGDVDAARKDFEAALTHFPDHPGAIVGLSNILLDLYCEKTVPPPAFPGLDLVGGSDAMPGTAKSTAELMFPERKHADSPKPLPTGPLGLGAFKPQKQEPSKPASLPKSPTSLHHESHLEPPYKAAGIPKVDRLASRDRAYGLLSNLSKLGSGWNNSEAWFALARAYEESGQLDKAKDVLWWCVELEEGAGVREWGCVNAGGYVL
ncbi:putative filamentation protein [Diaporthe ampelina]|uniref:Putative filamentation protein n=1 Tax=Diaporthe ampelina TaxID=1214573 RepID=A0A0G2FI68_9PEZI|nr:putative filamentation protein [Diaporthe ampelina]